MGVDTFWLHYSACKNKTVDDSVYDPTTFKVKDKMTCREGREHNSCTIFHLGYIWWSRSWIPWSCRSPWSGLPLGQRNRSAWWLGEGRWLEYGIEVTYYNWAVCLEYRKYSRVVGRGWLEYTVQYSWQASHGRLGTGLLERTLILICLNRYKILSRVTCHLTAALLYISMLFNSKIFSSAGWTDPQTIAPEE